MRLRRLIAVCLSCSAVPLGSSACDSAPDRRAQQQHDSAGIAIFEYRGEDQELSWSFTERLRLGGADTGAESFFALSRSLVAADAEGFITVLDRANYRLVQFDDQGALRWMTGRQGGGPGEFEMPGEVLAAGGGKVAVYDYRKRALLWFDTAGSFTNQASVRELGTPWGLAVMGPSLVFGRRGPWRDDNTRVLSLEIATGHDTSIVASVQLLPTSSQLYESCAVRISLPPFFAPTLLWRAGFGSIAVNTEPRYVVEVFRADGSRLSLRRSIDPLPASEAAVRRDIGDSWNLVIGASRVCPIPVEELIEKRGLAAWVPTIRDLALAPDGSVWVQRWTFPDERLAIDIYSRSGVYLGTLAGVPFFPIGFLPRGDVMAVVKDEWDVQQLVVYRIDRG